MPDRFPAKGNFQGKPFERIFTSNKFLSAINATKNSSPNKCKKCSCGWESSLILFAYPGVLAGENYIDVSAMFEA